MTTFASLFKRARAVETDVDAVRTALADRRESEREDGETAADRETVEDDELGSGEDAGRGSADVDGRPEPSPARVVADADVLAADLLVGGTPREALDRLRRHSWTTLVASDALLNDAEAVITMLSDAELAGGWRTRMERWREPVTHVAGDHPALASAYHGGAMQVVSLDPSLTGPAAGAGLRGRFAVSVREPRAFAAVFSPARLHPEVVGGEYPGPDRDPRN
ncbi:DUF7384 family protein [Halorubrum gandharaense]